MGTYRLRVPASRVGYVPEAQGGSPPGRRVLYVLGARTSHARTAYRGTPGTMCLDPGVPRRPPPASAAPAAPGQDKQRSSANRPSAESSELDHPGEGYILSRDSNRYVVSFDHFCEFVGNDIGSRNMGCFVGFLVSLALLASLLLLACVAATAVMWLGWTPRGTPQDPNPDPNPDPDPNPNPNPDPNPTPNPNPTRLACCAAAWRRRGRAPCSPPAAWRPPPS